MGERVIHSQQDPTVMGACELPRLKDPALDVKDCLPTVPSMLKSVEKLFNDAKGKLREAFKTGNEQEYAAAISMFDAIAANAALNARNFVGAGRARLNALAIDALDTAVLALIHDPRLDQKLDVLPYKKGTEPSLRIWGTFPTSTLEVNKLQPEEIAKQALARSEVLRVEKAIYERFSQIEIRLKDLAQESDSEFPGVARYKAKAEALTGDRAAALLALYDRVRDFGAVEYHALRTFRELSGMPQPSETTDAETRYFLDIEQAHKMSIVLKRTLPSLSPRMRERMLGMAIAGQMGALESSGFDRVEIWKQMVSTISEQTDFHTRVSVRRFSEQLSELADPGILRMSEAYSSEKPLEALSGFRKLIELAGQVGPASLRAYIEGIAYRLHATKIKEIGQTCERTEPPISLQNRMLSDVKNLSTSRSIPAYLYRQLLIEGDSTTARVIHYVDQPSFLVDNLKKSKTLTSLFELEETNAITRTRAIRREINDSLEKRVFTQFPMRIPFMESAAENAFGSRLKGSGETPVPHRFISQLYFHGMDVTKVQDAQRLLSVGLQSSSEKIRSVFLKANRLDVAADGPMLQMVLTPTFLNEQSSAFSLDSDGTLASVPLVASVLRKSDDEIRSLLRARELTPQLLLIESEQKAFSDHYRFTSIGAESFNIESKNSENPFVQILFPGSPLTVKHDPGLAKSKDVRSKASALGFPRELKAIGLRWSVSDGREGVLLLSEDGKTLYSAQAGGAGKVMILTPKGAQLDLR